MNYLKLSLLTCCFLIMISCNDDPDECEMAKLGTVVVKNLNKNGILKVHFNKERIAINGPGDLNIKPGEEASMNLGQGKIDIVAILQISDCQGNRCSISTTQVGDEEVSLASCQTLNLAY